MSIHVQGSFYPMYKCDFVLLHSLYLDRSTLLSCFCPKCSYYPKEENHNFQVNIMLVFGTEKGAQIQSCAYFNPLAFFSEIFSALRVTEH